MENLWENAADMEKEIIKIKCPDNQSNGICYYDCQPVHCYDCEYGKQLCEKHRDSMIMISVMKPEFSDMTCKELREHFVVQLTDN